jgi:hypothetical protein
MDLDSILGTMLQDDMQTDNFGVNTPDVFDSLFDNDPMTDGAFASFASDPILGNPAPPFFSMPNLVFERPAAVHVPPKEIEIKIEIATNPATAIAPGFGSRGATAHAPAKHGNKTLQPHPFMHPVRGASLAPNLPSLARPKQNPRVVCNAELDEEEKKEKKRLAVRKCREKKRKEMKELEHRAGHFDEEVKTLRQQLKRARAEGRVAENSTKNLEQVQALVSALSRQDSECISAIANNLVDDECTATIPCVAVEAQGKAAVLQHFRSLGAAFNIANLSTSFTFDSDSDNIMRCSWSADLKQLATAFGVHPNSENTHTLKGACRLKFCDGKVIDVVCIWDHSAFLLQILGIPTLPS